MTTETNRLAYRPAQFFEALGTKPAKGWQIIKEGARAGILDVRKMGRATIITAESAERYLASLPKAEI